MNQQIQFGIRLTADGAQATGEMQRFGRAVGDTRSAMDGATASAGANARATDAMSAAVGRYAAAAAGAFSVGKVITAADEWGQLSSRIDIAAGSADAAAEAQARLMEVSNRAYKSYGNSAELYIRTSASLRELGYEADQALGMVEALQYGLTVSSASQERATNVIDAWSKSILNGKMGIDEYQSVIAGAPRLQKALADSLHVSNAELQQMARDGKLTTDVLVGVADQVTTLAAEADKMPVTMADAFLRAENNLTRFAGSAEANVGVIRLMTDGITLLGDNIEITAAIAGGVAVAAMGRYAGSFAATTAAKVRETVATQQALREEVAHQQALARTAALQAQAALGSNELAAARQREATATAAATAAQARMVTVGGVASAALTALGGPLGALITLLGVGAIAWTTFGDSVTEAGERAEETHTKLERLRALQRGDSAGSYDAKKQIERERDELADLQAKLAAAEQRLQLSGWRNRALNQARVNELSSQVAAKTEIVSISEELAANGGTGALAASNARYATYLNERRSLSEQLAADLETERQAFAGATKGLATDSAEYARALEAHNRKMQELRDDAAKKARSGVKDQRDAFADLMAEQSGLSRDFAKDWETLTKAFDSGKFGSGASAIDALAAAQAKLLAQQPAVKAAAEATKKADEAAKKSADERAQALQALVSAEGQRAAALIESNKQAREDITTMGMTEQQLASYTSAKLAAAAAADEQAAAELDAAAALLDQQAVLPEVAREYRLLAAEKRRAAEASREASSLEVELGSARAAASARAEWQRTSGQIEGAIYDAIISGGESAGDVLERTFRGLVLEPTIRLVAQGGANLITGLLGSLAQSVGLGDLVGAGSGAGGVDWLGMASNVNTLGTAYGALAQYITGATAGASTASLAYANTVGYFGGDAIGALYTANGGWAGVGAGAGSAGSGAAAGGTGVGAFGSVAAGLGGGLWAYNATGSYTAGVAGAAGSTALYGAVSGYLSGAGAAAGASSALGTLGPYGWIAAAVIAILGDILAEEPDPRLLYQMQSQLSGAVFEDQISPEAAQHFLTPEQYAQWQIDYADTEGVPLQAVARGAFGYIGLHQASKDVDAKDLRSHFESLAALDNLIASGLTTAEVERTAQHMDGWIATWDTRRDSGEALRQRLEAIVDGIGGSINDEMDAWATSTQDSNISGLRDKWEALQEQSLAQVGPDSEADTKAARAALDESRALNNADWLQWVQDKYKSDVQALSQSLGDDYYWADYLARAQYGDIGVAGDQRVSVEDYVQRLLNVIRIDDLQAGLAKMGQEITRDAAMAWMDAATYTVKSVDASGKETSTDLTGFGAVAAQLEQVHAILYATPLDSITAQWDAYKRLFTDLGEEVVPSNIVAFRTMMESIDLNTESGRALYLNLVQLAPQVVAIQDALLATIGTSRSALLEIVSSGLTGAAAPEALAKSLNDAVLGGIRAAITADVANQITDLMIGGVINPAIEAMVLGADLSQAISSAQIDATVAEIERRATALEAIAASPALQASLETLRAAMERIGVSVGGVGAVLDSSAVQAGQAATAEAARSSAYSYSSAASAASSLRDEFAQLRESLMDFRRDLTSGDLAQLSPEAAYQAAQAEFTKTDRLARLGNADAMADLESVARDFLDASQAYYASSAAYFADRDAVLAAIDASIAVASRKAGLQVPQFAAGGDHLGGMRLVGERGPELEVTGPARIYSAEQTMRMLAGGRQGGDAATQQLLTEVLVELRALVRQGGEIGTDLARRIELVAARVDDVGAEVRRAS